MVFFSKKFLTNKKSSRYSKKLFIDRIRKKTYSDKQKKKGQPMILFLIACISLILGYMFYGAFVEKVFGLSSKDTPAVRLNDGVDYMVMPTYKAFLIQLLNLAGLGPVFGAILGALYGPVCLIWIVIGCIFAGAVHDYLSGMLSLRNDGKSLTYLMETYFGKKFRFVFLFIL